MVAYASVGALAVVGASDTAGQAPAAAAERAEVDSRVEDDANIIATIDSAPTVQFDLSADGLINLSGNKVSISVINAMRQRMNRPAPRRATAPARRKN